jgi:hypothetical protein
VDFAKAGPGTRHKAPARIRSNLVNGAAEPVSIRIDGQRNAAAVLHPHEATIADEVRVLQGAVRHPFVIDPKHADVLFQR